MRVLAALMFAFGLWWLVAGVASLVQDAVADRGTGVPPQLTGTVIGALLLGAGWWLWRRSTRVRASRAPDAP